MRTTASLTASALVLFAAACALPGATGCLTALPDWRPSRAAPAASVGGAASASRTSDSGMGVPGAPRLWGREAGRFG